MAAVSLGSRVRARARALGERFEISTRRPWPLARALGAAGFLVFAGITGARWLHTAITQPFHIEQMSVRDSYAVTPIEHDAELLRRWLPAEGKIGYWSEPSPYRLANLRLHVAPLLLDTDWRNHDLVLVDQVPPRHRGPIETRRYSLVVELHATQSFATGMRIYRRNP